MNDSVSNLLCVVAALAATLVRAGISEGQDPPGQLVLSEESALELASDFNFSGLSKGDDGSLVVWAREPNAVLRFSRTLRPGGSWVLPDSLVPLAAWWNGHLIEVVTTDPPAIHDVRSDGSIGRTTAIIGQGVLLDAARGQNGWYFLTETVASGALEVRHHGSPYVRTVPSYGGLTVDDEEGVWLTETRYPFAIRDLTRLNAPPEGIRPARRVYDRIRTMSGDDPWLSDWVSLPVVRIEGGLIQTLADLSRDRRVIVVYDNDGETLSSLVVDAPLGLLASASSPSRVYGARRTNVPEIVEYSYRWTRPRPVGGLRMPVPQSILPPPLPRGAAK